MGKRTQCLKKYCFVKESVAGVSVISTRGKLEVLQRHYECLGKVSVDSDFNAWSCCFLLFGSRGGGVVLRQLREGHIVNLFMKVDKEHPGNNGDIIYYTIECGREIVL